MGLAPALGNSPGQGDLLQSPMPARSLLNATFPATARMGDSALGSSLFARRYSGNPGWFLFLRLFICLNSAGRLA